MSEQAPLEMLSEWLEKNAPAGKADATRVITRVKEFVSDDVQRILGEDGQIAISVKDRTSEDRPSVFLDLVFPWESEGASLEQSRTVNELAGCFFQKVTEPLLDLRGRMGIHSWAVYNGSLSAEELAEDLQDPHIPPFIMAEDPFDMTDLEEEAKRTERFIGLVSPRMLRASSHPLVDEHIEKSADVMSQGDWIGVRDFAGHGSEDPDSGGAQGFPGHSS